MEMMRGSGATATRSGAVVFGVRSGAGDVMSCEEAQRMYCRENHLPFFAPPGGVCYSCGRNIYSGGRSGLPAASSMVRFGTSGAERRMDATAINGAGGGITAERAGSELITGCPYCHATFVD